MFKGVPKSRTKIEPPPPFEPSLFGFQRPRFKYPPITKQRILEAKAQLAKGDYKGCVETLRDLNDRLDALEKSITT